MHTDITGFARHQRTRGFSRRTIDRRRWSLEHFARHLGHTDWATVTPADVEAFLDRWPAAQSRQSIRSDVRQFYAWLIRCGHLDANPTDLVLPPRLPRREATPLSPDDLARAIDHATGRLRLALILGADAGLRVSEIARLHRRDIHLDRHAIVVRSGKGGKDDVLPMSTRLHRELAAWATSTVDGRPVGGTGDSVGALIRRHFRRLGIEARPHDLRHSFGTAVAERAGGSLLDVAALMRHESITTTQRYVRWVPARSELVEHLHDAA